MVRHKREKAMHRSLADSCDNDTSTVGNDSACVSTVSAATTNYQQGETGGERKRFYYHTRLLPCNWSSKDFNNGGQGKRQ
ncbi:hypothetical protein BaRGS_00039724 [Batillaria attramentaria]|uniref:Uncharacterized protein n=1 Tax=Batillaria attramentaria TaxID=370345 RepID=A0ABD0J328_9CAEN